MNLVFKLVKVIKKMNKAITKIRGKSPPGILKNANLATLFIWHFQNVTIWLLVPENMGIDTKIMFLSVLETKLCWNDRNGTFFQKKISKNKKNKKTKKPFSDIIKRNMCVNFYDCRSIGVARREVRYTHTHTYTHTSCFSWSAEGP